MALAFPASSPSADVYAQALTLFPGSVFLQVNKAVGFRLVTKGGTTGVFNLGRMVPLVGGPIGATVEVMAMRAVAGYARSNFPGQGFPTPPTDASLPVGAQ